MSQLDYSIDQAVGFEGELADLSLKDVETGVAEGEVLIGKAVTMGTAVGQVRHPALAAEITDEKLIKGLAFHHHAMEQKFPAGSGNYSYLDKASVNVLRKGRMWAKTVGAVTAGVSDVHTYFAGATPKGSLSGVAVVGETAILPQAKWKTSALAAGLAIVEIDL